MAPFAPFFAEALYQTLKTKRGRGRESVHLMPWPRVARSRINQKLLTAMAEVRRIAGLALALRAERGIKVRQPLRELRVKGAKSSIHSDLIAVLRDEVNVKSVVFDPTLQEEVSLDTAITPELRAEGLLREFTRMTQDMRQDAGLTPKDTIFLLVAASGDLGDAIRGNERLVKQEVNARTIQYGRNEKFDIERETEFDGGMLWIAFRRIGKRANPSS
jgi:isoleucyl-tRNA synthetase